MSHYDDALRVIPNASLTRSKAPGRFYPINSGPHYAVRGIGCHLYTDTGDELIDMLCGLGAISLGYGRTPYGARRAVDDGMTYSLPSVLEAKAAQVMLREVCPWAERVKFTKTGSESTHAAYRIAKHATGRPLVVVFEGAYHGWYEWSWRGPSGVPDSPYTILAPYGVNLALWLDANRHRADEIAAVFVEPHRWQPTDKAWLEDVAAFCELNGILLVFDEMIYGGRWALGGASEFFGVIPDLACYGKALGNGASIAAVVGPASLLEAHGEMVSGTFSGDTVGLSALIDTVEFYKRNDVIQHLWWQGSHLSLGLAEVASQHPSLDARVEGAAPVHIRLAFANPTMGKRFSRQMMLRDVLWHPDCVNLSYSHTESVITQVIQAADDAMYALAKEGA